MSVSLMTARAPGLAPSRRGFLVGCAGLATAIGLTPGGARSTDDSTPCWRPVCVHRTGPS